MTVVGDDDQAIYRFRGRRRRTCSTSSASSPTTTIKLERNFRSGRRILDAAAAVVAPIEARVPKKLTGASGGRVRFWRCRSERAQAQAVAAEAERLIAGGVAPEEICVLVRSVKAEGAVVAAALEERAMPVPDLRRGRLLPARRGARRARLAARAGRPGRLGRRGARARPAADRAALGRRGAAHPAGAPAQARHAERGGRRARGAAAVRGGPRPGARVPAPLPLGLDRLRGPPPGRVRDAPDRAHRAAPPAGVRHPRRHGRAAAQHRQAARAGHRLHAPRAAGHGARLRALPRRGGRVGPARGGGGRPAVGAGGAGDDDARRQGARVRPRLRARPVGRRRCPGRTARRTATCPTSCSRSGSTPTRRAPCTRRRCAGCCTWR